MKLSKRLEAVAAFVERGKCAADIGTDHGYIPIDLVSRGIVERAIAMDVKKGPLLTAQHNIREAGLVDKIETRLSDGLEKLAPGEAETVVIAGMGGELMIHILEEGRLSWNVVEQWVLSPHSELFKVRGWLFRNGFGIGREAMVREDGKFYTVLDVRRKQEGAGNVRYGALALEKKMPELLYGRYLIRTKNPVLLEYLKEEEQKLNGLRSRLSAAKNRTERTASSLREIEQKLEWNQEVQHEMLGSD